MAPIKDPGSSEYGSQLDPNPDPPSLPPALEIADSPCH